MVVMGQIEIVISHWEKASMPLFVVLIVKHLGYNVNIHEKLMFLVT